MTSRGGGSKKELICGTLAPNMAPNHNHKKNKI
jgi:hypothetical protein